MKPAGDNGVLNEKFKRYDFQGVLMRRLKDDRARCTRLWNREPARRADAPAIAWLEAFKSILRHRRNQVIAQRTRRFKEGLVNDAADRVDPDVVRTRIAAAIAIKPRHWLTATDFEGLAENVAPRTFDWFSGRHISVSIPLSGRRESHSLQYRTPYRSQKNAR